jgi:hypothetical protein
MNCHTQVVLVAARSWQFFLVCARSVKVAWHPFIDFARNAMLSLCYHRCHLVFCKCLQDANIRVMFGAPKEDQGIRLQSDSQTIL